jgi:hypothetical protein
MLPGTFAVTLGRVAAWQCTSLLLGGYVLATGTMIFPHSAASQGSAPSTQGKSPEQVVATERADGLQLRVELPNVVRPGAKSVRITYSNTSAKLARVHWRNGIVALKFWDRHGGKVAEYGRDSAERSAHGPLGETDDDLSVEIMRHWAAMSAGEMRDQEFDLSQLLTMAGGEYSLDTYLVYRFGNGPQKKLQIKGVKFRIEGAPASSSQKNGKRTAV